MKRQPILKFKTSLDIESIKLMQDWDFVLGPHLEV